MPEFELRYLHEEMSDEPDELQFRTVYERNADSLVATKWQSILNHTKKMNGDIVDTHTGELIEKSSH